MLLIAIAVLLLSVRIAYAENPMPARLEFSDHYVTSILERSTSATIEFKLPESGEFSGTGNLVHKLTMLSAAAGCTMNYPPNLRLKVLGKREGQQITFDASTDGPKVFAEILCPGMKRGAFGPPVEWQLSFPNTRLYVADKAEREILSQIPDFSAKATITLRLACPVTVQRPSPRPVNMIPALGQNPWPLVTDNTKTGQQLQALKVTSGVSGTSLGLTVLKGPNITTDKVFSTAQFGGGLCVSVNALTIEYDPIRMFIASKYKLNSCEYKATETHENLHYEDFSVLVRDAQRQMKEAGISAQLPSKEQPWYVQDEAEGHSLIDPVVRQTFQPIVSQLRDKGRAKVAERDTSAKVDTVLRKCLSW